MSQNKRMKMCTSCDGFVDLDVIVCPYCGNDLSVLGKSAKKEDVSSAGQYKKKLSVEETLSSLYPPPYNPKSIQGADVMKNLPEDPAINNNSRKFNFMDEEKINVAENVEKLPSNAIVDQSFWRFLPVLLFSLGANIILLGLYLLLFSTNGEIFVRWNAQLWYVYLIIGVPLIAFGYKMLSKSS